MAGKLKKQKYGRDLAKCKRYRDNGIREYNKRRRLRAHIGQHPRDEVAAQAVKDIGPRNLARKHLAT